MRPMLPALRATAAARSMRLGLVRARRRNRWPRPAAAVRQAPAVATRQIDKLPQPQESSQQYEHAWQAFWPAPPPDATLSRILFKPREDRRRISRGHVQL